jgi:NAD+ kinase
MRIGIYTNISKDKDLAVTNALADKLKAAGAEVLLCENIAAPADSFFRDSDIIAVIGGDGTILKAASYAVKFDKPILGINMGKVGFLSECEAKDIPLAAQKPAAGKFKTEQRTLLDIIYDGNTFHALNELVIFRAMGTGLVSFKVSAGGEYIDSYSADGFIVATPAGSTAYSLSAGGPILSPKIKGLALVSICSHSLHNRPIVISDDEEVKIEPKTEWNNASIVTDGKPFATAMGAKPIIIKKSAQSVKFIKLASVNFYSKIFTKLTSGGAK